VLCLIAQLARREALGPWLRPFTNLGRLGLTNYLLQSVVCTFVFYYWGLGWFNELTRVQSMGVVAFVYLGQMALSTVYLRFFRIGPMEWLWRSATYLAPQPLRR
jgi:uncharacterized protein